MLWNLFISVLGFYILPKIVSKKYPQAVLTAFNAVFIVFLLLLITNSPFRTIWNRYPDYFSAGEIPFDGRSLNPLLESVWMVIHPPVLFAGYTLLILPTVLTFISTANQIETEEIKKDIRVFELLGASILGIGIMLGGLWAYESLGWGGWWSWDPVENVSLLPMLVALIIIHTNLMQRRYNYFPKFNFALFGLQFVLILFSTFLTRTGIAANSMHTFAGSNPPVFYLLLAAMTASAVIIAVIIFKRREFLQGKEVVFDFRRGNFYMIIGLGLTAVIALFVFIGTVLPIISGKFDIRSSYFDNVNYLPASFALICIALSEFIKSYKQTNRFAMIISVSLIISVILIYVISADLVLSFLIWASLLAAVSSIISIIQYHKRIFSRLAHLGIALLFIGVVVSTSGKSTSSIISLEQGRSQQIFGNTVKYLGSGQIDKIRTDRETYRFILSLNEGGTSYKLYPEIMIKEKALFKEPAVYAGICKDIYVEPLALDSVKSNSANNGENAGHEVFSFRLSYKYLMSFVFIGGLLSAFAIGFAVYRKKK